jgi:aquaporin related protein
VIRSFVGYHWIYWVGPILGAIVASGFYKFIKILEYESANPDQDAAEARIKEIKAMQQAEADASGPVPHDSPLEGCFPAPAGHRGSLLNSGGLQRPAITKRLSTKQRLESPAMGTTDEAFHGLEGGMHAEEYDMAESGFRGRRINDSIV